MQQVLALMTFVDLVPVVVGESTSLRNVAHVGDAVIEEIPRDVVDFHPHGTVGLVMLPERFERLLER